MAEYQGWKTLLIVALAVRILYIGAVLVIQPGQKLFETPPDTTLYVSEGRLLLEHGEFLFDNKFSEGGGGELRPEVFFVPGYPTFLAMLFGIFGEAAAVILIFQAILSSLAATMGYLLCCHLAPDLSARWRRLLILLFALCPTGVILSGFVLSDTLFEVLFVGGLLGFVRSWTSVFPARWQLAAGLLWGLGLFTRPTLLIWPLAVPVLAWMVGLCLKKKVSWRYVLLSMLIPVLVGVGWTLRNRHKRGIATFSTNGAATMRVYFAAEVEAISQGKSFQAMSAEAGNKFGHTRRESPEAEKEHYRRMAEEASSIIRSHPLAVAKAAIRRLGDHLSETPLFVVMRFPFLQSAWSEVFFTVAGKLAALLWIAGIASMLGGPRVSLALLSAFVVGYFLALSSLSSLQGSRLMLPATTFWNLGVAASLIAIAGMKPLKASRSGLGWLALWAVVFGAWLAAGWSAQTWVSTLLVVVHKAVFSAIPLMMLATAFSLWRKYRRAEQAPSVTAETN